MDIAELAKFSKGAGRLVIFEVSELPDDAAEDEHGDEFATEPRSLSLWRSTPVDAVFDGGILKSLQRAGFDTMGAVVDLSQAATANWSSQRQRRPSKRRTRRGFAFGAPPPRRLPPTIRIIRSWLAIG